jgi:hypothetical protein
MNSAGADSTVFAVDASSTRAGPYSMDVGMDALTVHLRADSIAFVEDDPIARAGPTQFLR